MRRWIAVAALFALPGFAVLTTASCGSQPGADGARGDAAALGDGSGGASGGGSGGGDSTAGGSSSGSGDGGAGGDDASGQGDDSGDDGGQSADSSSGGGDGACVPATACPATYHCGRYVDPCTGSVLTCGSPCTGGQICASGGGNSLTCQPKTCVNSCGIIGIDGCGVPINCGGCTGSNVCINSACVPQPPQDAATGTCNPLTCTPSAGTNLCGTVGDVCGNSIRCSCPAAQQCIAGVCSLPPPECGNADAGFKCGNVPNACGSGNVQCTGCPGGTECMGGVCQSCPAPSCGTATCGSASNACGMSVSCGGQCPGGGVCRGGSCCTPSTCAAVPDAGCAPVDLGCGVHQVCAACPGTETCATNTCVPCVPKTCANFPNGGCGHPVGCGSAATLDCCASGTACMNGVCCPSGQTNMNGICCRAGESNVDGICCQAGEVNYSGTCCKPTCDPHQAGAQVSCGVTLYCAG